MNDIPAAAAAVAEAANEAAAERVESVVAVAQERIAEAEATAQAITDAAIQTELGRQIVAVEQGISACQNENLSLRQTVTALETKLSELTLAIAAAATAAPAPAPAPQILSTPQPSEDNPNPVPEVLIPDQLPASESGEGQPEPARKPKRRVL